VEYQKGDDEKAGDLFDEYVDPETATPTIIQAAALVKYRSNKMDEAIALLKTATETQPNNAAILSTYGLALLDRDPKSSDGAKALEKSLALNPKQQRVRIALAKRYQALEQPEQAIGQLQKAYEAEPLDLMVQQIYFKSLFDNDQGETVKAAVEDFKRRFPDNARGPFVEGWYHMQKGNYDAAAQAFERSVGMKGNTEKQYSYAGLAQIYELQKKPQQAVNAWEFAIKADPNMTSAYARWIKIMRELKRNEEVLKFLSAVEKDTQAWPPSVVLAQLLVNDKNLNGAIEHIKIALERSNNAANVKQIAAGLYQEQGFQYRTAKNLDAARVSVMEAVKLYPENPDFLANLIQIELIAENIPEAQRLLDAFEKNDKNEGPRLFLQGVIRYAEKKPEEGIKLFRQSWSEAQNEGVADAIYSHYMRTEEKASALSFAQDWVEKLPKSYKANLIQAMDAQEKNKPKEAIKWYEKTIAIAPNLSVALNNLAWLYYEDKDERALELAKKAAALAPKSAEILDTYGWILVEMGDAEMGLGVLEQAAKLKPDNADIQAHLKKAKERR
jgi:cellulose synthase operon protein C